MKRLLAITCMATLAIFPLLFNSGHSLSCPEVEVSLAPCLPYLTGVAPVPLPVCCKGVWYLKHVATTAPDRRLVCNCVKQAAAKYNNLKDTAVGSLPSKCGTKISFSLSKNFNCNS